MNKPVPFNEHSEDRHLVNPSKSEKKDN